LGQFVVNRGTIKNLYIKLKSAPGSGNSWDFTLRKNGVGTALTVNIADFATTGNNTADSVSVSDGDWVSIESNPTSGPVEDYVYYGFTVVSGGASAVKTFTADAVLKASGLTKTLTADAILQLTDTKTLTVDAVLVDRFTKELTVDSILKATFEKTFTADAHVGSAVYTKTLTADAILQATFSKTFEADALLQSQNIFQFSVDAILEIQTTKTFTINAILVNQLVKTFTVDSLLFRTIIVSPKDASSESSPVYLVFTTSDLSTGVKRHFEIQVDKTSSAFGDIELSANSLDDETGWEYWDGAAWQPLPADGLTSAFYGNDVRFQASLTSGNKWWHVREKLRRDN